ncbi:MAG: hypothetical protein HY868_25580 [Chloroflexi bacterium]|nr:hypothetical protein [Chloroflexota bacterium]
MGHGVELSFDAQTWKLLFETGSDPVNTLCWGPIRKLTKRVMYWGDAYQVGGGQNTVVVCSRDGGATIYSSWDFGYVSGARNYIVEIACCKLDPKTAYVVLDNGKCHKTIDYGKNWADVTPTDSLFYGATTRQIAIHPTNPDIVVLACYGSFWTSGFFWSTTGGTSWSEYHTHASYDDIPQRGTGATITPNGLILASCDYFTRVAESYPTRNYKPSASAQVYQGDANRNGGRMDSAITGGTRVLMAGNDPSVVNGIVLSKTQGESFVDQYPSGLPGPWYTDNFTNCALSKSGMIAYVSIEGQGLYRSQDNCVTWEQVYTFVGGGVGNDYRVRNVVVSDPVNEEWVWMLAGENQALGMNNPKAIRFSENAGDDWEDVRALVLPSPYLSYSAHFALGYDKTLNASEPILT